MAQTDYYIEDTKSGKRTLFHRIMVVLLSVALLAAVGIGSILHIRSIQASQALDTFNQALADGRYSEALSVYRMVREKSVEGAFLDHNEAMYGQSLQNMEAQTEKLLDLAESKLRAGDRLNQSEIERLEGLAELTASRLISVIHDLFRDYLFDRTERFVVARALTQLGEMKNIQQGVSGLEEELEQVVLIRQSVAKAEEDLNNGRFWSSYQIWSDLLEHDDLGSFTREQIQLASERCRKAMYDPLLKEATTLMQGGRYLSAAHSFESLLSIFPGDSDIERYLSECQPFVPDTLVLYQGPIEFISIKPLINNPEQAFDGDPYEQAARDSMLTVTEFFSMLDALYANSYILIDSDRLYGLDRKPQPLYLPPDKKPLVLVIEGINYYASRRQTGNAWNLVLDEGGCVAAQYRDEKGNLVIDRRGEAIGILDEFVEEHPDFSLDGAKGTLSLTGYECIFGYVTDKDQLDDRNQALMNNNMPTITWSEEDRENNRIAVREIVTVLKETGWIFASSTYGFINARDHDMNRIQQDTKKWLDQVGSLVGPVSILHYPNGAFIQGSDERAEYLKEQGFILFGGIGAQPYLYAGDRYIYVDKVPINGYTLRHSDLYELDRFFDAARIIDDEARNR